MLLGNYEVRGISFDVAVDLDGKFKTTIGDEEFEADTLSQLRGQINTLVLAERAAVPFVDQNGAKGVLRGYHAGQNKLLVTWENGQKGSISNYSDVWPEIDGEVLADLKATLDAHRLKAERISEIRASIPGKLDAADLFAAVLAERLGPSERAEVADSAYALRRSLT